MKHFLILALLLLPVVAGAQTAQASNPDYTLVYSFPRNISLGDVDARIAITLQAAGLAVTQSSVASVTGELFGSEDGLYVPTTFQVAVMYDSVRVRAFRTVATANGPRLRPVDKGSVEPVVAALRHSIGKSDGN